MSRLTPAEFLKRYDPRDIGDLCGDDGQQIDRVALLTDANLQAALDDADGVIDVALIAGGRYTAANLAALTGASLNHLYRITAQITLTYLWDRRPMHRIEERKAAMAVAEATLKMLRFGENVFAIPAGNITAGNPSIGGPTTVEVESLNLIRDRATGVYPRRRLPNDR